MSATTYRNLIQRREHRERPQPAARRKLGLLEKHSDYVARAHNYHSKEKRLITLKRRAAARNPDEFYFGMNSATTKGGVHIKEREDVSLTAEELKVMKTQDMRYITMMKMAEEKKVEKMKASLHGVGGTAPKGRGRGVGGAATHTLFVDDVGDLGRVADAVAAARDEDGKGHASRVGQKRRRPGGLATEPVVNVTEVVMGVQAGAGASVVDADPATMFVHGTAPAIPDMVDGTAVGGGRVGGRDAKRLRKAQEASYRELAAHEERKAKLSNLLGQMEKERNLLKPGRRVKVSGGHDGKPAVFKWKPERKR